MDTNDVLQFRRSFLDEVYARAEASEDQHRSAFASVFADYLAEAGKLFDFEETPYRSPEANFRKRIEIDGYSINAFEETINLVVCDFVQGDELLSLSKTEAMQKLGELKAFITETFNKNLRKNIEISDPANSLCTLLLGEKTKTRKYKLFLFSDRTMGKRVGDVTSDDIDGIPVELHIWTIDRLCEAIQSGGEATIINFSDYNCMPIPCVEVKGKEFTSYMCSVPGNVLADLYDKLDTSLLEGNIRSFLSTKVAVNAGIKRTINSEPAKFFVFNNGISATASQVNIVDVCGTKCISSIVDLQIVNGGQTTASLSNARYRDNADLSEISVAMKLTTVQKEKAKEIISRIAECANTQNKVNAADFFSNQEFCIKIEKFSRICKVAPKAGAQYDTYWFFERAKGQYIQAQMRKTPSQVKTFQLQNPKERLFTKTDMAKYRQLWDCLPHVVSKGAQTNFQEFAQAMQNTYEERADDFNEGYFKETIAIGILFKVTEKLVTKQEWYQHGYRAQIVAYSISLLSYLLKKQYPDQSLDFERIWREQQIPLENGVPTCIIRELTQIIKVVNEIITDDDRETINVTQWCKRVKCWEKVIRQNAYSLSDKILDYCIDKDFRKAEKTAARKDQKLTVSINVETEVFNYGAENWKRLYKFSTARYIASTAQIAALNVAMQIPNRIPNSYQAKKLYELLNKALDNGFKK
ncbi:MAG: AIPR family protein [Christensenellaceae bacterium]